MIVGAVLLAILAVAAGVVAWLWRPEMVVRKQARKRCLVTMKNHDVFTGLLWQADRSTVLLRDAAAVGDGGVHVAVDGVVLLHRADIAYVQLP